MFDCGINEIVGDMVTSMEEENEKMIYKAVQSVGIDIDKEQLEKALFNAKSFYNDGYNDAKKKYERRWIPVSERLPEEEGKYLTTDSLGIVCPYCGEEVEIDVNKLLTTDVWEGGCEDCPSCGKTIALSWNGKYD